jgi:UDP-N-acetylglucosamine--N-acetylmuramyl-(pentapeptide) pyrophosphoryl-undecaprenol N-acetylglucosamine transferase
MNILFVVCGEGLGHASRSLQIAKYLDECGYTTHIAAYGKAYDFLQRRGFTSLHKTVREVSLQGEEGLFSLSKTLWSSKGLMLNLWLSMKHVRNLIRSYDIDIVCADTMYAAVMAAKLEKIPSIFITNQNAFRPAENPDALIWKFLSVLTSKYLRLPDAVAIPDFKPPCTICGHNISITPRDNGHYRYIGPVIGVNPSDYPLKNDTVFASFGGEPFKIPLYHMLKDIADTRTDLTFDVYSTAQGLPASGGNFCTSGYVPDLLLPLSRARLAILHGGLTSLHEALLFEKPLLIIIDPRHPEQWNNARKIVELGCGTLIYGNNVSSKTLEESIEKALSLGSQRFGPRFAQEDGRKNMLSLINEVMENHGEKGEGS